MTGDALQQAITAPPLPPAVLVEDFLYGNCCLMLTGETGRGKSVLAAQLALSLSSATPLFSGLPIPHPCRVYYMQLEGSFQEQLRRLHFMQTVIPVNTLNLYWDADRQTPPLTRYERIATSFAEPPEVVILDPIYKLTGGDLAKAEAALAVVRFSDQLMSRLGCSIVMLHHPHREKLTVYGKPMEEEDFYYGHSFLKNHIEVSYTFKPLDATGERGQLLLKKRREENTLDLINLIYHPETYTCSMLPQLPASNKRAQVEQFLASRDGQTTSFLEVKTQVGLSAQFLRELQAEYEAAGQLCILREPGKRSIWMPKFPRQDAVPSGVGSRK